MAAGGIRPAVTTAQIVITLPTYHALQDADRGALTKKRQRIIPLNDQAQAIVRRLALKTPEGPIFRNADGAEWSKNSIVCRFKRMSRSSDSRSRPTAFAISTSLRRSRP